MADQSDVELTLATQVSQILYPQGAGEPSILGPLVRIYRGWPNQAALDADLAGGLVNVTVFPEPGSERNTTRYPADFVVTQQATPSLSASALGSAITFSGSAGVNQIAGVLADNFAAVHRTASGDSPALVAAILADQLRGQRIVQLSGSTLFVPGASRLIARVVIDQPAQMEVRRQRQNFRITCWCPDPAARDACASAIDLAFAQTTFLALPDNSFGRLRFEQSTVFDQSQDAALYRRDLIYSVEYATTVNVQLPTMIFGDATIAANGGPVVASLLS